MTDRQWELIFDALEIVTDHPELVGPDKLTEELKDAIEALKKMR